MIRRVIGFAVVTIVLGGCHSLAPVRESYIATGHPDQVVVRNAEGSVMVLSSPTVVNDSLVGTNEGNTVSVKLGDVETMVRRFSKPKTAGLVAGSVGTLGIVLYGAIRAGNDHCARVTGRPAGECVIELPECKYGSSCDP